EVVYPLNISELMLTTRIDGFADTRLHWRPDRGEKIPSSYTLRLIRPVRIGGRVVGPDGKPVAGAKVGFNHQDDPAAATAPENHEFGWIEVATDTTGRWSINRIAPDMIRRIYGSAGHLEYAGSPLLFVGQDPGAEKQLREGTHAFKLRRAVIVRGDVVDPV